MLLTLLVPKVISTHASLAGRDVTASPQLQEAAVFQPTRPLRDATAAYFDNGLQPMISTHASLAGRDTIRFQNFCCETISTHASLAGRDAALRFTSKLFHVFQPTRPLRDATHSGGRTSWGSILFQPTRPLRDATSRLRFHKRVPCGTRRGCPYLSKDKCRFQPTRPLRDATDDCVFCISMIIISTHASLAGRDIAPACIVVFRFHFNPRVPCGTRLYPDLSKRHTRSISTHASLAGRDPFAHLLNINCVISTHASLAGRDSHGYGFINAGNIISTHASLAGRDKRRSVASGYRRNFNPRVPCGTRQAAKWRKRI